MNATSEPPRLSIDHSVADNPVRPTRGLSLRRWSLWWAAWYFWLILDTLWFRLRVRGAEALPKDGPLLILGNHTGTLDALWAGWAMQRPLHYMAATSVLRIPVLGKIAAGLGAFAKKKYVRDIGSMKKMIALLRDGQAVMVYPEGMRTWDGRGLPLIPGMGRLICKMKVPVVYMRLETTFLAHPRWATYPRFVPARVTFDGPYTYGPTWSADAIEADVLRRISVVPRLQDASIVRGYRLAWGLPGYLWACPVCAAEESLGVDAGDGDRVTCRRCQRSWRLDLECVLHGDGDAPTMELAQAIRRVEAAVGMPPVVDPARLEGRGLLLEAQNGLIRRCLPDSSVTEPVTDGTLRLSRERLSVAGPDGSERWGVDLVDIEAVSVEVGSRVYVRTGGELYILDPAHQSTCKWGVFLRAWRAHQRGDGSDLVSISAP
jgi:1-acyl-sn-glycerol-3-phosphate acyltransferase